MIAWSRARSWTDRSGSVVSSDGGLLLPRAGTVQVRRADLAAAQQLQPLGEDVLELLDRPALQEHVPVGAGRLLGLHLGLDAGRGAGLGTAPRALPEGRDVGLDRHRHLELVAVGAAVSDLLAGGELDPALVLEALTSESCPSQRALSHGNLQNYAPASRRIAGVLLMRTVPETEHQAGHDAGRVLGVGRGGCPLIIHRSAAGVTGINERDAVRIPREPRLTPREAPDDLRWPREAGFPPRGCRVRGR